MIIEELGKPANRNDLIDMNTIIKSVYNIYVCTKEGIIAPMRMDDISEPNIFGSSIFIRDAESNIQYDFLKDSVINPNVFGKALRERCDEFIETEDGLFLTRPGKEKFHIGARATKENIDDLKFYKGLSVLDEYDGKDYTMEYIVDNEVKDALLNYETLCLNIGSCNGKDVSLIATLKLFPAIKKADNIVIYGKQYNDEIYDIMIISVKNGWKFFSNHKIINI